MGLARRAISWRAWQNVMKEKISVEEEKMSKLQEKLSSIKEQLDKNDNNRPDANSELGIAKAKFNTAKTESRRLQQVRRELVETRQPTATSLAVEGVRCLGSPHCRSIFRCRRSGTSTTRSARLMSCASSSRTLSRASAQNCRRARLREGDSLAAPRTSCQMWVLRRVSRSSRSTRSSARSRCSPHRFHLSPRYTRLVGCMAAPPHPTRSGTLHRVRSQQLEHKQQTTSLTIKEDKAVMEEIKKLSSGKVACAVSWGG